MGKTSYQNINALVGQLSENLSRLNDGALSLEEVEMLVDQSRELYERLVVLRYKAYENFNNGSTEKELIEKDNDSSTAFDFTQVSDEDDQEEITQPGFDFTMDSADSIVHEDEPIIESDIASKEESPEENESLNEKLADQELPLHETLKEVGTKGSLRKELQSQPVKDIKTEISIARRFEYISCMFNGDSNAYDDAINVLNNCENAEDARNKLSDLSSNFNWDLENKAIIKFVELVERRYM